MLRVPRWAVTREAAHCDCRTADKAETQKWQTRRDPEHLTQNTQGRWGWHSGGGQSLTCHIAFSLGLCPSVTPHPPHNCSSPGVFVFVFLRTHSLTFHCSYRGRHQTLFSYGNLYQLYIYIYIFCKSYGQPSWSGKNTAGRVRFFFFPATWVRFVFIAVGSWLKKGKEKKMLFK
jgi:hypothetical protein